MRIQALFVVPLLAALAACGSEEAKKPPAAAGLGLPAGTVASAPLAGAKEVAEVKASAKEGDAVVVRGIVGGVVEPIVANRAVFTIGDVKGLETCKGGEDHCKTPWDACCQDPDERTKNTLTVQFLGGDGKPLAADVVASGIKPMTTVVVSGRVGPRPDPKVLVVDASSVFVEK